MRVLKFTQTTEAPTTIFCYETIGFGDGLSIGESSVLISDSIGFRDVIPVGEQFENLIETMGFDDSFVLLAPLNLVDTIGFNDSGDQTGTVTCFETIGLNDGYTDSFNEPFCVETIGFHSGGESSGGTGFYDIIFTWFTRSSDNLAGYGASEYGANLSYGEGNTNLTAFELHFWGGRPENNRILDEGEGAVMAGRFLHLIIPIADSSDPDADATYTLTAATNIALGDNLQFRYNMAVEIYVQNADGVFSYPKYIYVDGNISTLI